jgi:hypothetical protein
VGIFDADVYGPSLPLMVDPAVKVLEMDAATKAIYPTEYEGVKVRQWGWAAGAKAARRVAAGASLRRWGHAPADPHCASHA